MKIRLFQLEVLPGRPEENTQAMLRAIDQAKQQGLDMIVFPEMAIPGYLLGDEWERTRFLEQCQRGGEQIAAASDTITVVYGNVAIDPEHKNEDGRIRKYNALFVAEAGRHIAHPATGYNFFIKVLMPNYREFDDNRYFFDPRKLAQEQAITLEDIIAPVPSRLGSLGCLLCEDGWEDDYNVSPLTLLHTKGCDLFINISASPYTLGKNGKRNRVFGAHARRWQTPMLYVNHVGLQDNGKTVYTFDGASCVYDASGKVVVETETFRETHADIDTSRLPHPPVSVADEEQPIQVQFEAIAYGTRQFMQRMGIKKVVVGISGGIDSALVAAIYRHILPPEHLMLVSMPGPFTSQTTRDLSRALAQSLDCSFSEIPIESSVNLTRDQLAQCRYRSEDGSEKNLEVTDFVLENIQARDRSSRVLAGVAAAFGGVFTCNANKSEMTVGYSTLYGDLGGYLANIADLWKTEVYAMARFINEQVYSAPVIPEGTLNLVPSAELSAQQNVDTGHGDPLIYPYHDRLFASWVERWQRATPEDNLRWYRDGILAQQLGFEGTLTALFDSPQAFIDDLERWWNLYQGMAVAKRIQAPPVLAVKRRAFGFDHREAQLGPRYSQTYQAMKAHLLNS